jgi:hypothetical protein
LDGYLAEYKAQLAKGALQRAYRGLIEYMAGLRTHFADHHPEYGAPGGLYQGYMDMTYFALFPPSLKARGLKIALVFLHESFAFEVWLSGGNRTLQAKYRKLIADAGWKKYAIAPAEGSADYILRHSLAADPDFSNAKKLTARLEGGVMDFIRDMEAVLPGLPTISR